MIDYVLKQKVLLLDEKTSILKLENQYSKMLYAIGKQGFCPPELHEKYLRYIHFYFAKTYPPEYLDEVERINNATYERTRRLRAKINWLLQNFQCSFLTFNFNDYTLSLDAAYRRTLIQRTCVALDTYYIGNIDFGSSEEYVDENGCTRLGTSREHYHVLVAKRCDTRTDSTLFDYCQKYGHVYVESCRMSREDVSRLSRYTAKLANHAVKSTAQRSALLFSRKYQIPKDLPDLPKPEATVLVPVDTLDILCQVSVNSDYVFSKQLSFFENKGSGA